MRTPRSTTTFVSRAERPISTSGSTTAPSTWAKELTRTRLNSSELRKLAPETMQPPETSDEMACPRRPSTSWTNLAGAVSSE